MALVITDAESKTIISENLRQVLAESGMSQGDLAREMQLPGTSLQSWRQRICRWCNGETLPTPADLMNLSELLEIEVADLLSTGRKKFR